MAGKFRDLVKHIGADPIARAEVDAYRRAMEDALALGKLRGQRDAAPLRECETCGTSQASAPKLEARIDPAYDTYLSTLSQYVEALGGRLEITAVFPEETIRLVPTAVGSVKGETAPA
jgi:hypothetical protein